MVHLSDRTIGDAYTSEFSWNILEDLTRIGNRMSGQMGEQVAASILANRFDEAGLRDIKMIEFEVPGWWRGSTTLTVSGQWNRTFDDGSAIIALPGSPSENVTGELVDIGYGTPTDFETADTLSGKLVIAKAGSPESNDRWIHRNEKYAKAMERGASGFLFQSDTSGCLPPTGYVGFEDSTATAEIPAAGISYELGHRLRKFAEGDLVPATLSIDCRSESATSQNVHGVVGPDTDEEILVGAHYDSHDIAEGAGDNGAGVAIISEIGRLLTREEDKLDTKIRIIGFGAEEIGMLGAYQTVNATARDSIKMFVNNDGVGNGRTLTLNYSSFEHVVTPFKKAASELSVPIDVESHIHPHGDKWPFAQEALASCSISSGESGRFKYAHSYADTLDKIDKRDLRALAVTEACAILRLAKSAFEIDHKSPEEISKEMEAGYEQGLKSEGRWPFDD